MTTWRLLRSAPGPGSWHMAVDEALLESYRIGQAPPTLRLYDWASPTLSLGYAQKLSDVRLEACRAAGVEVVRRPTGGRAVLHGAGDTTYAVVAGTNEGFPGSVTGAYVRLARALEAAMARLHLPVRLAPGELTSGSTQACFATATRADLLAHGKKLVGSSQLRREGGFLQHGAIMLAQAPEAIMAYVGGDRPASMTHLQALMGREPQLDEVHAALVAGFEAELGIGFEPGELSPLEHAFARRLAPELVLQPGRQAPGGSQQGAGG